MTSVHPSTRCGRGIDDATVGPLLVIAEAVLLALLTATVGLGPVGWLAALLWAVTLAVLLARALRRDGWSRPGPADLVTAARAVLVGAVLALITDLITGQVTGQAPAPVGPVTVGPVTVRLTVVALVLDGVDGRVARRTGTTSAHGARFDLEVDAALIAGLSVAVATRLGWWVLLIGAARYLYLGAGLVWPWLRGTLPVRYWAKVVAVVQALVLTVVSTGWLPRPVGLTLVVVALALLTESFGRSVWWLARRR